MVEKIPRENSVNNSKINFVKVHT